MVDVKVFVGIPRDMLQVTLKNWLEKVKPIEVLATSQSEGSSDSINLTVFYDKISPKVT